jgi:hypothetical protein
MKLSCYLIVSYNGSVEVRKRLPFEAQLRPGQLVLPLRISVPDSAFSVYLSQVELSVPESPKYQAAVELAEEEGQP